MKKTPCKKLLVLLATVTALLVSSVIGASACTTIYVGADRTEEGTPFVARTEDYGADMNKLWFISEAGAFKEGTTYRGCPAYGAFEWTFTHDSYRFTYFTNDIYYDSCPECGEGTPGNPPTHYSYTEFGTNEHGLSVSATETIYGNGLVNSAEVDPMRKTPGDAGIEETDIPFVLLAEAKTAREGVELLLDIYDTRGAYYASGIFVCDRNETWYVENCSGTQYVAIKLNNDMIFLEPNTAVIGAIDLDDENVLSSDRLIEVAQQAGTFVGDAEENIIDFRASYARLTSVGAPRMVDGLNFLNMDYNYTDEDLLADNTLFTISNLDEDGEIVPFYTNIEADRVLTKTDVFDYYKLSSIGKPSNQEIEIFQLFSEEDFPRLADEYATVGWVGVGNMSNNVFVPYYPMLIDEVYEGYQVSTPVVNKLRVDENDAPEGFYTWYSRGGVDYYVEYPENWMDSYYFTFEGLGGYILYAEQITGAPLSDYVKGYILNELDILQQSFYEELVTVKELKAARDPRALATENGMEMARKAHELGRELVYYAISPDTTVTLVYMDGDEELSRKYYQPNYGFSVAEGPTKNRYTFKGWDTDPSSDRVKYNSGVYYSISDDTVLYAVWEKNSGGGKKPGSSGGSTADSSTSETITSKDGTVADITTAKDGTVSANITVPANVTKTTVTIPVKKVTNTTVAVIVYPDGTRAVLSDCVPVEGGLAVTLTENATLEIVDNAKTFSDTASVPWAKEAIAFVSAREIFAGYPDQNFGVSDKATRSMIWTVLAKLSGEETAGGAQWFTKSQDWAKANGISDGTNPDGSVTREQMAVMLWKLAGAPAPEGDLNAFTDSSSTSSWAAQAMTWMVNNNLLSGKDGARLDPQGEATRAELAVIMTAYLQNAGI